MNQTKCVVCETTLTKVIGSTFNGAFGSTAFEDIIIELFCPECKLIYKISNPHDTQTIGAD